MSFQEIISLVSSNTSLFIGVLLIVSGLIQISPIKFNPWTAIGRGIGKWLNQDITKKVDEIQKKQNATAERLEHHIVTDDDRDADMRRMRILRFSHDIMRGLDFAQEYYDDMLKEIDVYEGYCRAHDKYENGRAVLAIAHIKKVYQERLEKGTFVR